MFVYYLKKDDNDKNWQSYQGKSSNAIANVRKTLRNDLKM